MEKIPVLVVEHVTKGKTGHIKRGAKCCEPVFPCSPESKRLAMLLVESQVNALLDEHSDLMILITLEKMTMEEIGKMDEFVGW